MTFEEKQSFVYSVLVTFLKTGEGRELIKEYEGDTRTIISKFMIIIHSQTLHIINNSCNKAYRPPFLLLQRYESLFVSTAISGNI